MQTDCQPTHTYTHPYISNLLLRAEKPVPERLQFLFPARDSSPQKKTEAAAAPADPVEEEEVVEVEPADAGKYLTLVNDVMTVSPYQKHWR